MNRAFLNVGYELNEDHLRAHFAQFGSISDLYLPKHGSGRRKGYGFVTFDSSEALARALLAPAHSVEGIVVQVKRAGPRPPVSDVDVPSTPGLAEPSDCFGRGPRLYIGGVADAVSEDKIRQHFAKWGSVKDVYFPGTCYKKRVNYCFVTFGDWASAQQACNQSDRVVDGSLVDAITVAGARQQEPAGLGCPDSPHSQAGLQAAAQSEPLASLPAYPSWLQQHSDHFHASPVQAAQLPTPLGQPIGTLPTVPLPRLSLAEQQHVFMQGVHAGMQINSLNAPDGQAPLPRPGSSPSSWSNLQPGGESPAKPVFDWFPPGLSPAGLSLPPQYSAQSRQMGMYTTAHQALAAAAQPYDHPLYRF